MELQIRELTIADSRRFTKLIKDLSDKLGNNQLLGLMTKGTDDLKEEKEASGNYFANIGVEILKLFLTHLENEIVDWFSDLLGVDKEQYMMMPIDTEIKVVEQIASDEHAQYFFNGAWQLAKRIKGFAETLKK